jgi:hypothetical protein
VFCRTPFPRRDPAGSQAHILVGPRLAGRAADVLRLFDSPTWWRGEPIDAALRDSGGELPEIDLEEFEGAVAVRRPEQPRVSEDDLAALAEAVLSSGGTAPVILPQLPMRAVATMVALAHHVPSLADLVGFSTHEVRRGTTVVRHRRVGQRRIAARRGDRPTTASLARRSAAGCSPAG